MKKRRFLQIYLTLVGVLALLAVVLGVLWLTRPGAKSTRTAQYLLKDHAGHVALYSPDGAGPLAEYQIYTRLLPEQDVLALQQGVAVADEAELQRRLEDYGL